jgi:DNA-binding GntR family transcriptional regulator
VGRTPDAARDERIAGPLFVIARTTARRAIALLGDQGLIATVSQRGSYVL